MDGFYDVIIVGGGVIGCLCARELTRYRLRVLLLEKEADVCSGASKANSGIVHACLSPKPGTNKATLCLAGNRLMEGVCDELGVPFRRTGALTVALHQREERVLRALLARGESNGEIGLGIVRGQALRELEPSLAPEATAALWAPSAGIVNPMLLTIAAAENAVQNGAEVLLGAELVGVMRGSSRVQGVVTTKGEFGCRFLVNAAGCHAGEVMAMAGATAVPVKPRRGDYYVLDKMELVRHVLFPIPTPVSKGILVTPTTDGNVLLGPTSVPSGEREEPPVDGEGLQMVWEQAQRMVHSIDMKKCISVFAGVRASGPRDFVIEASTEVPGLVNLVGIESPGVTASPAIARRVAAILAEEGVDLEPNPDFDPMRKAPPRVSELSPEERAELVERDRRYGRVVCRCEDVTEGEIVDAIRAPVPARTLEALKKRTRIMAGRCQGGFDLPLVVEILARELGIEPWEVTKSGPGSEVLVGNTRSEGTGELS